MWTLKEIIQATSGKTALGEGVFAGVSIDSRTLKKDDLFLALKGEQFDGHDYIAEALAKGAGAVIASSLPQGIKHDAIILVEDTYQALLAIARATRLRTQARFIGVTGSVGKTGTKEAIKMALGSSGKVYATQGNLNNHIGLPLSLANMPIDTQFGVFELGMNHAGEIAFLTEILQPHIAVITNVEAVHLEFFESIKGIADAKAEIMQGLVAQKGTIILNHDNPFYAHLVQKAESLGVSHFSFGEHAEANFRLLDYRIEDFSSHIEAEISRTPIEYQLGTVGKHWAITSLCVLAVATVAKCDLANAAASLANFHEPKGRGKIHLLEGKNITLMDDSYNASPVAVKAAIAKLDELYKSAAHRGRKIVILGDMKELGAEAITLHQSLLPALLEHHIDKLYTAGALMQHLHAILPEAMRGIHAENAESLKTLAAGELQAGDLVLVKGSHSSNMQIISEYLIKDAVSAGK